MHFSHVTTNLENWMRQVIGRGVFYRGIYPTWDQARLCSSGYDGELILEKVKFAVLQVKSGKAVYERDSVLFDKIFYPFPLLTGLLNAALAFQGKLSVLDFGGSLGSTYFQCQNFLKNIGQVQWGVVEQPHFVKCGREFIEDHQLLFFDKIRECAAALEPNVVLVSSSLQYLPNPYVILDELIECDAKYLIFDRTPFCNAATDFITVQYVPKKIYPASYPCWIFSRGKFLSTLLSQYELVTEFDSHDRGAGVGAVRFQFGGMILKRRASMGSK